ncbi:hypothetical protein [Odoribacter laneus]|uniref:hypothetical protein n=1 Tax=Odoribacter laneus TaxID=626933 RepID=UPI003AB4AADE
MKKMLFLSFIVCSVFVFSSFMMGNDIIRKEDSKKHLGNSDCPGAKEMNSFMTGDCCELFYGMKDGKCACGGNLRLNYKAFFKWVRCPLQCENGKIKVNGKYEKCTGCTPSQDGDGHGKVKQFETGYVCDKCGKKYRTK